MQKRSIPVRHYILRDINPIVRFLIMSDILMVGAAGMLAPIFALFVEDYIEGSNEAVIGIAAAIYLITKSVFQIPIATLIDKIRGERDDYFITITFSLLASLSLLLYLFISEPWQLYIVEFIIGLFEAMTFPSFMAIFTRHIDKHREGTEWGVYFTVCDLSSAGLAAIGGYLAYTLGFAPLIISVSAISALGALTLIFIKPYIKQVKKQRVRAVARA